MRRRRSNSAVEALNAISESDEEEISGGSSPGGKPDVALQIESPGQSPVKPPQLTVHVGSTRLAGAPAMLESPRPSWRSSDRSVPRSLDGRALPRSPPPPGKGGFGAPRCLPAALPHARGALPEPRGYARAATDLPRLLCARSAGGFATEAADKAGAAVKGVSLAAAAQVAKAVQGIRQARGSPTAKAWLRVAAALVAWVASPHSPGSRRGDP
jgi:hypothetical protein